MRIDVSASVLQNTCKEWAANPWRAGDGAVCHACPLCEGVTAVSKLCEEVFHDCEQVAYMQQGRAGRHAYAPSAPTLSSRRESPLQAQSNTCQWRSRSVAWRMGSRLTSNPMRQERVFASGHMQAWDVSSPCRARRRSPQAGSQQEARAEACGGGGRNSRRSGVWGQEGHLAEGLPPGIRGASSAAALAVTAHLFSTRTATSGHGIDTMHARQGRSVPCPAAPACRTLPSCAVMSYARQLCATDQMRMEPFSPPTCFFVRMPARGRGWGGGLGGGVWGRKVQEGRGPWALQATQAGAVVVGWGGGAPPPFRVGVVGAHAFLPRPLLCGCLAHKL